MGRYLRPAINECTRLGFRMPLSLAVIYDSITHGSWERLSSEVSKSSPPYEGGVATASVDGVVLSFEKRWITEYVHRRDQWLASVPRLTKTRYRTQFFLQEIARKNWELTLPINPNGCAISQAAIDTIAQYFCEPRVPQT